MSELELPPSASASILSLRAFDYDLASALADIVDNSISAGAKKIEIKPTWDKESSSIAVIDDGRGMSESTLHEAMRFGSTSPTQKREPHDLGRFGLGLKTASIWACRRVTVLSKQLGGDVSVRVWDVDHVIEQNAWIVGNKADGNLAISFLSRLKSMDSGTIVVWEKMDTLLEGGIDGQSTRSEDSFNKYYSDSLKHIAMVFHRFIEKHGVTILSGNYMILPWNPLSSSPSPELAQADNFSYKEAVIKILCGVMPHPKRLSQQQQEDVGGPLGWYAQQGFYIYRRDRIIVAGGWLGLLKSADHYKLARIAVDVPNSLDLYLGVSVTKTNISLPDGIKIRLKHAAEVLRERAYSIYRHRGRKALASKVDGDIEFAWTRMEKVESGLTYFLVNKQHQLYRRLKSTVSDKKTLDLFISLLEETLPTADIGLANSNRPDSVASAFDGDTDEERLKKFRDAFSVYRSICNNDSDVIDLMQKTYPFSHFPEIILQLKS